MMRWLVALSLLLIVPAAPVFAEGEAVDVVDAFHAALRAGDRAKALSFLADDALIFESGHAEQSKAEYEASHVDADMEFEAAVTSTVTQRRRIESDGFAFVASEGHTAGKFRGRDVNNMSTETMVLRDFGEGWKIVHIHWSSASEH